MNQTPFSDVRIATSRLVLRSFTVEDKEEFHAIIQDPRIYRTLPEDHMYDREEVDEIIDFFIHSYSVNTVNHIRKFPLAIVLKESGAIIGDVGIGQYSQDVSRTEIFYFLNSEYWNMGFASEAVSGFLEYIRENRIVEKLIGTVVKGNVASARILEKNGFTMIDHTYPDERIFYELDLGGGD